MKKIFILILICVCFVLAGCDYGGAVLIQNSNGSIVEYYYVPYDEQALCLALNERGEDINISRGQILPKVKQECDEMFGNLLNEYQQRVGANQSLTMQEKTDLIAGVTIKSNLPSNLYLVSGYYEEIRYEITYADSTCYAVFKEINPSLKEEREIVETNNFFTITTKVVKDPIFDKIASSSQTIGTTCVNLASSIMEEVLGPVLWQEVSEELNFNVYSSKFEYTYVVPTARIHTNATAIQKSSEGYYYHTWQIDLNNVMDGESAIKIEYWTVQANRPVWYILALVVALGIAVSIWIIGNRKEKLEIDKFKIED